MGVLASEPTSQFRTRTDLDLWHRSGTTMPSRSRFGPASANTRSSMRRCKASCSASSRTVRGLGRPLPAGRQAARRHPKQAWCDEGLRGVHRHPHLPRTAQDGRCEPLSCHTAHPCSAAASRGDITPKPPGSRTTASSATATRRPGGCSAPAIRRSSALLWATIYLTKKLGRPRVAERA